MSETIEIEIGDLYASLHKQFTENVGERYTEQARTNVEDFLHDYNKQFERQVDQQLQSVEASSDEIETQEE